MSAHKIATITYPREKLEQLRQAEMRQLFKKSNHTIDISETESIRNETQKMVSWKIEQLEERESKYKQLIEKLECQVQDLEYQTSIKLQTNQHHIWKQVEEVAGDLSQNFQVIIENQQEWFERNIEEERIKRQRQVSKLRRHLGTLINNQTERNNLAVSWYRAARDLYEFIQEHYDHNHLLPEKMGPFDDIFLMAQENYSQGFPEATLISSQQAYVQLSDLHLQLELLENKHTLLKQTAIEQLEQLIFISDKNRFCKAISMDGSLLDQIIDVDMWADGKISVVHQKLVDQLEKILDPDNFVIIEEFEALINDEFQGITNEIHEIVSTARLAVLDSQVRINIADTVIQALSSQGFGLMDHGYISEDKLSEYKAILGNISGDQITVWVTPGQTFGENTLQLDSNDAEIRTEHELTFRAREIFNSLSYFGLESTQLSPMVIKGGEVHAQVHHMRQNIYRVEKNNPQSNFLDNKTVNSNSRSRNASD